MADLPVAIADVVDVGECDGVPLTILKLDQPRLAACARQDKTCLLSCIVTDHDERVIKVNGLCHSLALRVEKAPSVPDGICDRRVAKAKHTHVVELRSLPLLTLKIHQAPLAAALKRNKVHTLTRIVSIVQRFDVAIDREFTGHRLASYIEQFPPSAVRYQRGAPIWRKEQGSIPVLEGDSLLTILVDYPTSPVDAKNLNERRRREWCRCLAA